MIAKHIRRGFKRFGKDIEPSFISRSVLYKVSRHLKKWELKDKECQDLNKLYSARIKEIHKNINCYQARI